jgi:hypothetical protein
MVGARRGLHQAPVPRWGTARVELLTGPVDRPYQERTLHIADPDGNVIEYAQKLRARP